ncbi:Coatomer beta subunit [Parasponia andersonii]|uniref:Coatomer beta subunit n=1 Tax=Parasponia andersonii TaxID=3476 RepID=A0A2P5ARL8_PARAD|nr:Coatomer beta subunit [Parasponia andersonii]
MGLRLGKMLCLWRFLPSEPSLSSGYAGSGKFNPSSRSLKIISEIRLVLLFLAQLRNRLVETSIRNLVPFMVAAISIPGPENVPAHLKTHFNDLKVAQVKTISLLTYLIKRFADYVKPYEVSICNSIVNLVVTCPESVAIRKELLVSVKLVLETDCKRGLSPLIDKLLEERVLVRMRKDCFETMWPLAEIVHRGNLSLSQQHLVRANFASNTEGIYILVQGRILDAFMGKFSTLKLMIPQLLEEGEEGKDRTTLRAKLELPVQAVLNLRVPVEHSKEVIDCKHLIKTLATGMKTLIWSITHRHFTRRQGTHPPMLVSPSNIQPPQSFKGLREDEVLKASGVLKSGVHCLGLFKEQDEEKEVLTFFSDTLAIMEPRDLMDVLALCMPELVDCMIFNTRLVHIFSTLLGAPEKYWPFVDVLVNFLVNSKLDVLKHPKSPVGKLVLHLFQFIFGAVSKASPDLECILQAHVPVIMEVCMKNATEVERPLYYIQLLGFMFRAFARCKFELLMRDLIPKLQPCLNMLLTMLEGPTGEDMRDLLLELCLTLPARLSTLLPHLSHLMKPLILGLKGSGDLVSLSLRTLEFWVDSLNPEFLEPSMASVVCGDFSPVVTLETCTLSLGCESVATSWKIRQLQ